MAYRIQIFTVNLNVGKDIDLDYINMNTCIGKTVFGTAKKKLLPTEKGPLFQFCHVPPLPAPKPLDTAKIKNHI